MTRRLLLFCGILAPLLYIAADVAAATSWHGYSYAAQTISELSAIGAPTRPLMLRSLRIYSLLVIAFGAGVWISAGDRRRLRITGALLVAAAAVDMLMGPFAPMHLRGADKSLTDTLHIALAGLDVLFILLIIGFGATSRGARFRFYSVLTLVTVLVFGALTGMQGPSVAADQPTPWIGVAERICVYAYMVWLAVLAAGLLRAREDLRGYEST